MQEKVIKKKWNKHPLFIIFIGIPVGLVGLITFTAIIYGVATYDGTDTAKQNSDSQGQTAQPQQNSINYIQPKWEITNTETVGYNYIVATGYLVNKTNEAGVADCNIEFYDREINWAGGKGFGGQELQPGDRYDFTVQVEVDNVGLISKQNIHCEDGIF